MDAFIETFESLGFETCDSDELEEGFRKIAIYGISGANPKHLARQLVDGKWTSKLGQQVDIQHDTLDDITGPHYGSVLRIMRKAL